MRGNLPGFTRVCEYFGELLQLFRLGFGGDIGGKAATSNVKSPRR